MSPSWLFPPRRHRRRPIAMLAALAVATGLLLVAPTPSASADTADITDGSLSWGVRTSFRTYMANGGTIDVGDGASVNDDGTYDFPVSSGSYDSTEGTTTVDFGGSVHFYKYASGDIYLLDLTISNPTVVISADEQTLYADVVSREYGKSTSDLVDYGTIEVATLGATESDVATDDGVTTWSGLEAYLSEDAVDAFGGFYSAGSALDPVSFSYTGDGGAPDWTESWDAAGTPALAEGDAWYDTTTSTSSLVSGYGDWIFPTSDGSRVYVITQTTVGGTSFQLTALDADSWEELGSMSLTTTSAYFDYDAATDSIFYDVQDGTTTTTYDVHALTWDEDSAGFTDVQIGSIDASVPDGYTSVTVQQLVWNEALGQVQVFVVRRTSSKTYEAELRTFAETDGSWAAGTTVTLDDPPSTNWYVGGYGGQLTVASDGSILIARSKKGKYDDNTTSRYYPVLRITIAGDTGTTQEIDDSIVTDDDGNEVVGYDAVSMIGDDTALVTSGDNGHPVARVLSIDADTDTAAFAGDAFEPLSTRVSRAMSDDTSSDIAYLYGPDAQQLVALDTDDDTVMATYSIGNLLANPYGAEIVPGAETGVFYVTVANSDGQVGVERITRTGFSPTVTTQPESQTVTLGADDDSSEVTFSAAGSGDPSPSVQWQSEAPGKSSFSDIDGATGEELTVAATRSDDGTRYRAVFTNDAGEIATEEATVTVDYPAVVTSQPEDTSVTETDEATFGVVSEANPEATVTWQRRVDGFWTAVDEDSGDFTVDTSDGTSVLTIADANTDMSGVRFRAKLVNDAGTTFSDAATLTVNEKTTIPSGGLDLSGVTLEWTGNEEMQDRPYYGSANYFSAGTSDGTEDTYAASEGNVQILQADADGEESAATYATRAAHVGTDGYQLVKLSGGEAKVASDGSATVTWDGTWSVNFYDGLAPFWFTDPTLTVDADGEGTLTADMDGYAVSMDDPTSKTALDEVDDVTVATFSEVDLDPYGNVTVSPDYEGVEITVPSGETAQDTTSDGWGSWPQSFVDFQFDTGLSSYWYSSGSSLDSVKAPRDFTVDFTDATETTGTGGETGVSLGKPVVTGTARVGTRLVARASATPSSASLSYQWYAAGAKVRGATGKRLTLGKALVGERVWVTVTAKHGGSTVSRTSARTGRVAKGRLVVSKPKVKGTARVGRRLTAKVTVTPAGRVSYRWYAAGKKIAGATHQRWRLAAKQAGKRIRVEVTVRRAGYQKVVRTSARTHRVGHR
ncbi:MAG: HtaA domain-containing protein [Nocardioides sp.]|uniref:HtaA domain-containing protein n=1 Tax=Nocardioides sp. TaxID=35761 RepID=UPI0039E2EF6A